MTLQKGEDSVAYPNEEPPMTSIVMPAKTTLIWTGPRDCSAASLSARLVTALLAMGMYVSNLSE